MNPRAALHRAPKIFAAGALLLGFAATSAAQTPPAATAEPDWSVQEVVVTAPSPRLWKLTKGQSTVWILGALDFMPKTMSWNTAQVSRVIAGSDLVLLPPTGEIGVFQALGALSRSHLPKSETLDEKLSPDVRDDYHRAVTRLGHDPAKYQHEKPTWAALMLLFDLLAAPEVTTAEPIATVRRLARERHVKVVQVAAYNGGPMLDQVVRLPEPEGVTALASAAHGVNFALDHVGPAGQAWAAGRLADVHANISPDSTANGLLGRTQAYQALYTRAVNDTVQAVSAALDRPGTTFAVFPLTSLARRDGAFDKLRAQGVAVSEPAE